VTNGGDLDEMLDEILRVGCLGVRHYMTPETLGEVRAAVRKIYEAGYNDCAETFNLGVRITHE
jgi:hypothetical protein